MKEKLIDLYLRKCQIRRSFNDKFRTAAYKPGKAEDSSKRDTKSDFNKVLNGNPKLTLLNTAQDGNTSYDVNIITDRIVKAPISFIEPLEKFIFDEFFEGDERTFDTKREFIASYEETTKKYEELNKVLKNKDIALGKLAKAYIELNDTQKDNIEYISDQYKDILIDITKELRNFSTPIPLDKFSQKAVPQTTNNIIVATKISLVNNLTKDFVLSLDANTAYLQHKTHHIDPVTSKLKDPRENKGSFTADIVNNKNPKFQFHNNPNFSHYDALCISVNKALKIFKAQNVSIQQY